MTYNTRWSIFEGICGDRVWNFPGVSVLPAWPARFGVMYKLRGMCVDDEAFVAATWRSSFWRGSPWGQRVRWPIFRAGHGPIIRRLMGRSRVLVACDPEDENYIFGYLVFEASGVIHWAYVRPEYRRVGILRAMVKESGLPEGLEGVRVTHATSDWFRGAEKSFPGAVHDPYGWMEAGR